MAEIIGSANGSWVKSDVKLLGKTVLITGANTGIGLWTAIDLAERGAKVILACRNTDKAEQARAKVIEESQCAEDKVVVKSLDISSLTSVRKCAEDIIATEDRLDILINNAGVMMCPESKTEDGFETQFGVNYIGHFVLTNKLLDLIKKSAPSRIVVVGSVAHKLGSGVVNFDDLNTSNNYTPWKAYCQSKLCNVLFSRHLSNMLKGSGVTVNCLCPGSVRTELQRHVHSDTGEWRWKIFMNLSYLPGFRTLMGWKTPKHGAQTSIYCAIAPELDCVTGKYFSDCKVTDESTAAQSDQDAEKLWKITLELTGDGQ